LLADLSRPPLHDISLNPEAMKINKKAGKITPLIANAQEPSLFLLLNKKRGLWRITLEK
jgi:hypothetical protein